MIRKIKTVVWVNVTIAIFFVLTVLNEEFLKVNFLRGILTFIHELLIFPLAVVVVLSLIYAVFLFFKNGTIASKIVLLLVVMTNIFLTFVLPSLKY